MVMTDRNLVTEQFDPPSKNGVFLLSVEKVIDGYLVKGGADSHAVVDDVKINGRYIGTSEYFETECDDFEFIDDGEVNLLYE